MRRTKLICTLGPASADRAEDLARLGMDIGRVNFSHGTDDQRVRFFRCLREAEERSGRAIGILADLSGPKVRLGELACGEVDLVAGEVFALRASGPAGDASGAPVTYPGLIGDLRLGDGVLLADGAAELRVVGCDDDQLLTEVIRSGTVRSRAGINVPSERLSMNAVTEKDCTDAVRALDLGADMVAQSFVRRADDITTLRGVMNGRSACLVAKVETRAAVEDFDNILRTADAVMIARGDLGVEIPFEEIPVLQKELVTRALAVGVPVIVATQMLESMTAAPRPTRAEASDIANAVLEGADALMLSAETAIGDYPLEAAAAAVRIVEVVERSGVAYLPTPDVRAAGSEAQAIAQAAAALSRAEGGMAAICCFTRSGRTAELLSSLRPRIPVFAYCTDPDVVRRLTIRAGVMPLNIAEPEDIDDMVRSMARHLEESQLVERGSLVVMVASAPRGGPNTNFLKAHRVGD